MGAVEVNGPVCSVKAFETYTNVNFWRGAEHAERTDPDQLLAKVTRCATSASSQWMTFMRSHSSVWSDPPSS